MKFYDFYKTLTIEQKESLAEKMETSKGYLDQIATGHRKAGNKILEKINNATNGKVSICDFFEAC